MDLLRTNSIKVVGRLKSQDLKIGNRKDNGAGYISGNAIIISNLDGRDCEFEISFYAAQKTKEGKDSQLFTSYSKMGELVGKKIEVTGDIRESRFFSKNADQIHKNLMVVSFVVLQNLHQMKLHSNLAVSL